MYLSCESRLFPVESKHPTSSTVRSYRITTDECFLLCHNIAIDASNLLLLAIAKVSANQKPSGWIEWLDDMQTSDPAPVRPPFRPSYCVQDARTVWGFQSFRVYSGGRALRPCRMDHDFMGLVGVKRSMNAISSGLPMCWMYDILILLMNCVRVAGSGDFTHAQAKATFHQAFSSLVKPTRQCKAVLVAWRVGARKLSLSLW